MPDNSISSFSTIISNLGELEIINFPSFMTTIPLGISIIILLIILILIIMIFNQLKNSVQTESVMVRAGEQARI
jgi:hypothetical protein